MGSFSGTGAKTGQYSWSVTAQAAAHLDYWLHDYFDGLTIKHSNDGRTSLTGLMPDMPAVYGLIIKLRDAGVDLLSLQIQRIEVDSND